MSLTVTHPLRVVCLLFALSILSLSVSAQNLQQIAKNHVISNSKDFSLNVKTSDDLLITNMHSDEQSNLTHIYMNQMHDGMKIYNAIVNISLDENGEIFHVGNRLVNHRKIQNVNPRLSAQQAVSNVASFFSQSTSGQTNVMSTENGPSQKTILENSSIAKSEIVGELMYVNQNGTLVLTWSIAYLKADDNFWWDTKVNAIDGSIVEQTSWTVECDHGHGEDANDHSNHKHTLKSPNFNREETPSPSKKTASAVVNGDYYVSPMPNESPNHGPLATVNSPWNNNLDPAANPFTGTAGQSWHNDGAITHFTTRGNNVWAVEDIDDDDNQAAGFSPPSMLNTTGQQYNFVPDFTMPPAAYQEAAITNLFYWNNIVHDVMYHYGFNEECGNFQETNATGLGLGDDSVNADAIDGDMVIGPNNATFGTPPDGLNPRMQMFPFTNQPIGPPPLNTTLSGNLSVTIGAFPEVFANIPWTAANDGALVLALDNAGTNEACGIPAPGDISNTAALMGNVALIDRGACIFTQKVENAEAAGAIAVVICNNVAGDPFPMQGTPANPINIPSIMISMADCNTIKANLPGVSISFDASIPIPVATDKTSDYDNGIIVHEYGHGWSTRLTGGAANSGCLTGDEQMGEGWSDFLGIIFTMKPGDTRLLARGVGTYAIGQPVSGQGIRPAPYSTDFAVNSLTYQETAAGTLSIPHGIGTVWATMLWDMTWDLIDVYGMGTNIYESNIGNAGFGGQNLALRLVTEALKLQPCNPGFVDGRDAILAADQALYGGIHNCLIWNAFARRGLGVSAQQGSSADLTDNVEAFDVPDASITKMTAQTFSTDGSTVTWDLDVTIVGCSGQGAVTITDNVDPLLEITSVVCPSPAVANTAGNVITITHPGFGANTTGSFACTVNTIVTSGSTAPVEQLFFDDIESGNNGWTINDITATGSNQWDIVNTASNSPTNSWFVENGLTNKSTALESPTIMLGSDPTLSFYHQYDTEFGWDGGFVEISTDGGTTWNQLAGEDFCLNGYNSTISVNSPNVQIVGKDAWSGNSGGFIRSIAILDNFAGLAVNIRFLFGEDNFVNEVGWWVDDIEVNNGRFVEIVNTACVSPDSGASDDCSTAATCAEIIPCQPGVLGLVASGTDATCETGFDGTATVSGTGGVTPYTYLWSNNQTSSTATGLTAGTYSVTVTDANGCGETVNVIIGALPDVCPLDPSIPTMGEWGLISLFLLLLIFGIVRIKESEYSLLTKLN